MEKMSVAGNKLLHSVEQARAFVRGESQEGFVIHTKETLEALVKKSANDNQPTEKVKENGS